MSKHTISESEVEDGDYCECIHCGETSRLLYDDYEEEEEEKPPSVLKSTAILLAIIFLAGMFLPIGIITGFEILELFK